MCNIEIFSWWYCEFVAFTLTGWQTTNGHTDSTPLSDQVLQDLMKYLQMSQYKDDDCDTTDSPYVPDNGNGWNTSKKTRLKSTSAYWIHRPACPAWGCHNNFQYLTNSVQLFIFMGTINHILALLTQVLCLCIYTPPPPTYTFTSDKLHVQSC